MYVYMYIYTYKPPSKSIAFTDGLKGARCLCVCNYVGDLSKHSPRLSSKLKNQLRTGIKINESQPS